MSAALATRRRVELALAFGIADILASALGVVLASMGAAHAIPSLLAVACACLLLWAARRPALSRPALLAVFLVVSSVDNLLAAATDGIGLSLFQLASTGCASFMLALLGLEGGTLVCRLAGRLLRLKR